jgi:hypothetical protein
MKRAAFKPCVGCVVGVLAAVFAATARAELVELQWSAAGEFEHRFEIAPAKFAEVCGKLARGARVAWRFDGSAPSDFNIHYHAGNKVVFPAQRKGVTASRGTFKARIDQDYCWMWTNPSAAPLTLRVHLAR